MEKELIMSDKQLKTEEEIAEDYKAAQIAKMEAQWKYPQKEADEGFQNSIKDEPLAPVTEGVLLAEEHDESLIGLKEQINKTAQRLAELKESTKIQKSNFLHWLLELQNSTDKCATHVKDRLEELEESTSELSKLAPTIGERKYVQKKIKEHDESLIDLPYVKTKCGRCGRSS